MRDTSPHSRSEGDRSSSPKGDRSSRSKSPDFAAELRFRPWYKTAQQKLKDRFGERFRANLPKEQYDQMKQEIENDCSRAITSLQYETEERSNRLERQYGDDYIALKDYICNNLEMLKVESKNRFEDVLKEFLKTFQKEFLKLRAEQREKPKEEREHIKDIQELYKDLVSKKDPYRKHFQDLMTRIDDTKDTLGKPVADDYSGNREFLEEGSESTNVWKTYIKRIDTLKEKFDEIKSKFDEKYSNTKKKIESDEENAVKKDHLNISG